MTTDLEKQFFDTFGIKPYIEIGMVDYPTITDRILLELICIYSRISNLPICVDGVDELKEAILEQFIENSEDFKQQIQALFKEE